MSRRKLPYIRLYLRDYFDDTSHLSVLEHGAYLLLLMRYTQTQEPPREERIPAMLGMGRDEWLAIRDEVAAFFVVENGRWRHKRCEAEIRKVRAASEAGRKAGKASGRARKAPAANDRSNDGSTTVRTSVELQHTGERPTGTGLPVSGTAANGDVEAQIRAKVLENMRARDWERRTVREIAELRGEPTLVTPLSDKSRGVA